MAISQYKLKLTDVKYIQFFSKVYNFLCGVVRGLFNRIICKDLCFLFFKKLPAYSQSNSFENNYFTVKITLAVLFVAALAGWMLVAMLKQKNSEG
jgi:hypothetical protein